MATPNTPSQNSSSAGSKSTGTRSSVTSPPPAYTPRRQHDIIALTARALENRTNSLANMAHIIYQNPTVYASVVDSSNDESAETEDSSPISLRINTSVSVNRSNNIVCLAASPAEHANAIAQAVVKALNEGSSGRCGIPMIDENGAPRPLRIEVDAGMVIEGSGNIVGNQELISEVLRKRNESALTRRSREDEDEDEEQDGEGTHPAKRQRSSE